MGKDVFRMEVWFGGRVQGVGFRYRARQVAAGFEVTGHVVNLADDRVELLAEGEEAEVRAFVAAVEAALAGFIRQTEQRASWGPRSGRDFMIG